MTETDRIIDQLNRAFVKHCWHGASVLETLDGLTAAQASNRPIQNAHPIWELVLHLADWKDAVRKRVLGNIVELTDAEDWPPVAESTDAAWTAALKGLKASHTKLIKTVTEFSTKQLHKPLPGRHSSPYFQIMGSLQHDAYHAAQIMILRKLL